MYRRVADPEAIRRVLIRAIESTLAAESALGNLLDLLRRYDLRHEVIQSAFAIFDKLAHDYPECTRFASKRDELQALL